MAAGLDHWLDIVVLVVYLLALMAVGLWTMFRPNRGNVKSFFLAGRDISWWPVGGSLYASNIGSEHFIGLAGTGAKSGIAPAMVEWMSLPLLILLSWVFLPVYISAAVYTLPEYLQKRFGGERLRIYLSCVALFLYVVTKIAVCMYGGALFIKIALGWDTYVSIAALLLITGLYTVIGGLAAVIYTDALQTLIMTIGAIVLMVIGFVNIGGYGNFEAKYMLSIANTTENQSQCATPDPDAFHMFRPAGDNTFPWPGLLMQATIGSMWYWCADQVIVQRTLAAKNLSHAKGGSLMAGYLKLLPLFVIIWPGMISRILYPDEVACVDPDVCDSVCDNRNGCYDVAYPYLVIGLLPIGLRGLLMASMLSAIMGSLTSIFNSASTLFTIDIYRKVRPVAKQRELLIVGRIFIVVLCGVSIAWVPLVQSSAGGQLFVYIQSIQGYLGAPIGVLFSVALFWPSGNEQGAFWGLLVGHVLGLTRMILELVFPAPPCVEEDTRPAFFRFFVDEFHYTYYVVLNLFIVTLIMIIVSKFTSPQDKDKLAGLTWWTRRSPKTVSETYSNGFSNEGFSKQVESALSLSENFANHDGTPQLVKSSNVLKSDEHVDDSIVTFKGDEQPKWRRYCDSICGLPSSDDVTDAAPEMSDEDCQNLLKEKPFWKSFLDVNAVIGLIVVTFMLGFFH